jgi:hypothetical protein
VEDQEELSLEGEDDALAEAPDAAHDAPLGGRERRLGAAQQRGTAEAHAQQPALHAARRQTLHVDLDVRQLGHAREHPASRRALPLVRRW